MPVGPHPDQDDALESQLAVLDLGDVVELGGDARDTAKRPALFELQAIEYRPASARLGSNGSARHRESK